MKRLPTHEKDLGGFTVRRCLPSTKQRMIGPWIFFDEMGPATFAAGKGIDVRPHPHINLATVTYLFDGAIHHRDSLGTSLVIRPGDINLMVAGSGIVHSERSPEENRTTEQRLHGLQLWQALPEDYEEIAPAFYHTPDAEIPCFEQHGISGRVMQGEAFGVSSPVKTFCQSLFAEANLEQDATLTLPSLPELGVYVISGSVDVSGEIVPGHTMAVITEEAATLKALEPTSLALIGGEPLGQRHIEWNFVSSRKQRIEQAKQDWREQRFALVPGDEKEFIPY